MPEETLEEALKSNDLRRVTLALRREPDRLAMPIDIINKAKQLLREYNANSK